MKNARLEIDERLKAYLADKDRAGCRGWLQYRIQKKYRREDFERLFNEIGVIDMSLIWDDADDPSLPPINENKDEWTEDYLEDVLNTLKFNFSKARFTHAIEVACALVPEQNDGKHGLGTLLESNRSGLVVRSLESFSDALPQRVKPFSDGIVQMLNTPIDLVKKNANEWFLNDIRDAIRHR